MRALPRLRRARPHRPPRPRPRTSPGGRPPPHPIRPRRAARTCRLSGTASRWRHEAPDATAPRPESRWRRGCARSLAVILVFLRRQIHLSAGHIGVLLVLGSTGGLLGAALAARLGPAGPPFRCGPDHPGRHRGGRHRRTGLPVGHGLHRQRHSRGRWPARQRRGRLLQHQPAQPPPGPLPATAPGSHERQCPVPGLGDHVAARPFADGVLGSTIGLAPRCGWRGSGP